jgi:hypothetical protein
MKTEKLVNESGLRVVTNEELQAVSGGWCGNDPTYWKPGPQPPVDPFRTRFDQGAILPAGQLGAQFEMSFR